MNRRRHDEMARSPKPPPGFPPMQGRSYSPGLARFLTQARLQEMMGGEHPYGYASCNPISHIDPDGTKPQDPMKQYLQGMNDFLQGLIPPMPVKPPKKRKNACDCPREGITSRVGQVWIDCNCKGTPIAVLPENGNINISPPCGQWIPADGVWLVNPFPWSDAKFIKIHGQTCLVIDCSMGGRAWPSNWFCYGLAKVRDCDPTVVKEPCKEFGPGRFQDQGPPLVTGLR